GRTGRPVRHRKPRPDQLPGHRRGRRRHVERMTETVFRPATLADIARLQPFVHAAYRGDTARKGWTHEADLLDGQRIDAEGLGEVINDPKQVILLAEQAGRLVGCVQVTDKGEALAYL